MTHTYLSHFTSQHAHGYTREIITMLGEMLLGILLLMGVQSIHAGETFRKIGNKQHTSYRGYWLRFTFEIFQFYTF